METLEFSIEPSAPTNEAPPGPGGVIQLDGGPSRAILLAPDTIDPARAYPLITVLHGAGRQDEILVRAYREEAARRQALFLVPRSTQATWDLFVGANRDDLDFLMRVYRGIYARYRIDHARQSLIGYSDGATYALAIGLSNPRVFSAVVAWAPGFVLVDRSRFAPDEPKPRVLVEHGTHDQVFPFEEIAARNRQILTDLGYDVDFRVDENGIHWPRREFQRDALDWLLNDSGSERGRAPPA